MKIKQSKIDQIDKQIEKLLVLNEKKAEFVTNTYEEKPRKSQIIKEKYKLAPAGII
jgi:hypothetical protein